MTTTYDEIPRFRDRIRATPLIVVARVVEIADVRVERMDEERVQVQTIFRLEVEEAIRGEPLNTLFLRVVGGETRDAKTESSVTLVAGERAFLLLASEPGREQREDAFVPYYQSAFQMDDDHVLVDEIAAKDLAGEGLAIEDGRVVLGNLRALIADVVRQEQEEDARLAEFEPNNVRGLPPPDVTEIPDDERSVRAQLRPQEARGARSARVEGNDGEDLFRT